jgi:hypothetical protein
MNWPQKKIAANLALVFEDEQNVKALQGFRELGLRREFLDKC